MPIFPFVVPRCIGGLQRRSYLDTTTRDQQCEHDQIMVYPFINTLQRLLPLELHRLTRHNATIQRIRHTSWYPFTHLHNRPISQPDASRNAHDPPSQHQAITQAYYLQHSLSSAHLAHHDFAGRVDDDNAKNPSSRPNSPKEDPSRA